MKHIFRVCANAPQDAEDRLNQKRRFDQTQFDKVRSRVEVSDVVALDFKASAVFAARLEDARDVGKSVLEDSVVTTSKVRQLPVVLEFLKAIEHREQPHVHRPHVQRCNFRLELMRGAKPIFDGHGGRTTCRDIDDDIARCLDLRQELLE